MTLLSDVDLLSIEFIVYNMRPGDREEIFGLIDHDNNYRFAWEAYHLVLNKGRGKISWHDGKPAAFAAFVEERPGVWSVWMMGTKDFKAAAMPLLRWFRKEANDILSVCKGHRLQCDSRADYEEAHKMIKAMGGIEEGPPMRRYGKDGSDYQRFIWLNGENDAVLKSGYVRAA
jgi:hypothetical protein